MLTVGPVIMAVARTCVCRTAVNFATKPFARLKQPSGSTPLSGWRLIAVAMATRASRSAAWCRQSDPAEMQPATADSDPSQQQAADVQHATPPTARRRRRHMQQKPVVNPPIEPVMDTQQLLQVKSKSGSSSHSSSTNSTKATRISSQSTAAALQHPVVDLPDHSATEPCAGSAQQPSRSSSANTASQGTDSEDLQSSNVTCSTDSSDALLGFASGNSDEVHAAISRITRFLDFRERCASEVLTKLQSLGYSRELARQVLTALQESDIQSDARFAEGFVRGYWRSKAQSPARLAYELRSKGVSQAHIDAALTTVFGDTRQLPRSEPGSEAEEQTWEHLVEACRRKVEYTQGEPAQKRRAKLAGWLQRRGHSMSTVFRIFDAIGI